MESNIKSTVSVNTQSAETCEAASGEPEKIDLKRKVNEQIKRVSEQQLADNTAEAVFQSIVEPKNCKVQSDDLPDTESESSSGGTITIQHETPPGSACYKPDEWLSNEGINRFKIDLLLAYGSYGEVYLVTDRRSNKKMALKKIQKNRPANSIGFMTSFQIDFEVDVTKSLDHINMIRCHDVFSKGNYLCMVLDYMEGGNLLERIREYKSLDEDTTRYYLRQLCLGVAYLHMLNIAHFDLKPDNLLLLDSDKQTTLRVADFGCSKMIKNGPVKPEFGGTLYSAPELLSLEKCSYAADIWSIGVVMFIALSGTLPFGNISAVKFSTFEIKPINSIDYYGRMFLQNVLTKVADERPSIHELLKDIWLSEKKQQTVLGQKID